MNVNLTVTEIWFIKQAIAFQDVVLPLSAGALSDKDFEEDYGMTKEEVKKAINSLLKKVG